MDLFESVKKKTAAILDFETTSLDSAVGQVIEGAVIRVEIDAEGRFGDSIEEYESFNDPGHPVPSEVTRITGITDSMVQGQRLDWDRFCAILDRADLLISHNARFDRAWLERFAGPRSKPWGCSLEMIDWSKVHRMPCRTLKHLAWEHGHFPNAHRALDDVRTLHFLLKQPGTANPEQTYGQELLDSTLSPPRVVLAIGSPFDKKDLLKARNFRWSSSRKTWWKLAREKDLGDLCLFLDQDIYSGLPGLTGTPPYQISDPVDPLDPAFKTRFNLE